MAVDSVFMARPLVVDFPPEVDELEAATPARPDALDNVDVVGLESAPASESDVVGVVVVVDDFVGAIPLEVPDVDDVESLLWVVVPSTEVVAALSVVELDGDVIVPLGCTEATGADFRISLCDLRTGADSFEVESVLVVEAVVRSDN